MEEYLNEVLDIHADQQLENEAADDIWYSLWEHFCILFSSMPWVVNSVMSQQNRIDKLWNMTVQFTVNYYINPVIDNVNYNAIARRCYCVAKINIDFDNIKSGMDEILKHQPAPIPVDLLDAIVLALYNPPMVKKIIYMPVDIPKVLTNYAKTITLEEKLRIPNDIFAFATARINSNISMLDFDAVSYMDTFVNVIYGTLPLSSLTYVEELKSKYVVAMLACITGITSYGEGYSCPPSLQRIVDALLNNISGTTERYELYINTIKKNNISGVDPLVKMELNRRETQ